MSRDNEKILLVFAIVVCSFLLGFLAKYKQDKEHPNVKTEKIYINDTISIRDTMKIKSFVVRKEKDTIYMDNGVVNVHKVDTFGKSRREVLVDIPFVVGVDSLLYTDSAEIKLNQDIYVETLIDGDSIRFSTDYPNVSFNNVKIEREKLKQKKFSIGPAVGVGYDFTRNRISPIVGVSFQYNLMSW